MEKVIIALVAAGAALFAVLIAFMLYAEHRKNREEKKSLAVLNAITKRSGT